MANANKSILQNVNEKSDATLVKAFFEEFNKILRDSKKRGTDLYLLDALEKLHFVNPDILKEPDF